MIRILTLIFVAVLSCSPAMAQQFPTRSIRVVVPYAAGGPTDIAARFLTKALSKALNQTVIIENIGGAGGNIGSGRAATSEPDGYTLLFNNIALGAGPAFYPDLNYDPIRDFEPLGISAITTTVILSRPDFPPADLPALLTYIRENPSKVTFGNTGPGGTSYLCQLLFMNAIGGTAVSVPFRGTAPAINELASGRIDMTCDAAETAAPHIEGGRIKAYGVTSLRRMSVLPNVPTLDEQGLRGFDFSLWFGLFAPQKTPQAILTRLSDALMRAVKDPEFREGIARLGGEVVPEDLSGPTALNQILARDVARWRSLSREDVSKQR
jgi:tripartite-type tricarboxylate transporter receptor subunit TctC